MSGKLILIATPIGNLLDISARALETLKTADFIAAEDTRVTVKLLNYFNIKKPLTSYFEHNKNNKGKYIIDRILAGETCALVSDAGMPAISDPGEDLVMECYKNNIEVSIVPGACALVSALAISGLPTGRFTFEGFLSVNKKSRFDHLESLKNESRTMIFYEAPHKLLRTLKDFYKIFGNRKISIVHEITKIHEGVLLATIKEASKIYENKVIKGEFVLVLEGIKNDKSPDEKVTLETAIKMAQTLLKKDCTISDAAKQISKITGFSKSDIYKGLIKG